LTTKLTSPLFTPEGIKESKASLRAELQTNLRLSRPDGIGTGLLCARFSCQRTSPPSAGEPFDPSW